MSKKDDGFDDHIMFSMLTGQTGGSYVRPEHDYHRHADCIFIYIGGTLCKATKKAPISG